MQRMFSHLATLIIEIILTIAIASIIALASLTDLRNDAEQFAVTTGTDYQEIIHGYTAVFKTLTVQVREEVDKNPSLDELNRWLQDRDVKFNNAVGPGTYDGYYIAYKGGYAHSWNYGDYSNYNAATRPWYQQAQKAGGKVAVVAPYVTYLNPDDLIPDQYILMTIAQKYTDDITFAMDIKVKRINALLADRSTGYKGTLAFLYDSQGHILSTNESLYYSHNIARPDAVMTEDMSRYILESKEQSGHFLLTSIAGSYRLLYTAADKNGNTVCLIYPFWNVFLRNILAVILIMALLIGIEILAYIRNRRKLATLVRDVQENERHSLVMLQSIAYHYAIVLMGNSRTRTYQVIKSDSIFEPLKNIPAETVPILQTLSASLKEEYQPLFQESLSFEAIEDHLRDISAYNLTVALQNGHWYTINIIRSFDYAKSREFFLCLENADEQMQHQENLEKALARAEAAAQAKTDFLSRMSHDIRTPLNGIIGMTEIAKKANTDPAIDDYLATIHASGHFLLNLINDILDVVKIESGHLELHEKPAALEEFTATVNAVVMPLMKEKGLHFIYKMDHSIPFVQIDLVRFSQIFFNLLSNSAKYTPRGGKVCFTSQVMSRTEQTAQVQFIVSDTGKGMSPEFLTRLFNPFEQEANSNDGQQWQGTGLGLAIVKDLTEKMGGSITVQSKPGQGTTFYLEIPMKLCDRPDTEPLPASIEKPLQGKTILLAEDNEINTIIAQTLLEAKGMTVLHAINGTEAAALFTSPAGAAVDIILMDIMMPVMNGLDATKKIRALGTEKARSVPIIAVTANAFSEDIQACLDAGMNAHLAKPIEPDELYKMLSRFL